MIAFAFSTFIFLHTASHFPLFCETNHLQGTPVVGMSLSRSPSPAPGGGWSSPGLDINTSGHSSPSKESPSWADSPTMRASPASFNQGFFTRHMRKLSSSLPRFNHEISYAEREKAARNGRWSPGGGGFLSRLSRRTRSRLLFVLSFIMLIWLWNGTRKSLKKTIAKSMDNKGSILTYFVFLFSSLLPLPEKQLPRWW